MQCILQLMSNFILWRLTVNFELCSCNIKVQYLNTNTGKRGINPHVHLMEMSAELQAPTALHSEKVPRYPLERRLGGSQRRSGHNGKKKNLLTLLGIAP
jgi:hypothetical protein